MDVDAVLFDLDGTLLEYERPPAETLAAAFEAAGVDPFFEVDAYYDRFEAFVDDAADLASFRRAVFEDVAVACGRAPAVGRRLAAAYGSVADPRAVRLRPGAADAVATLGETYALGLVTNGPREFQAPKLDASGLDGAFQTTVYAGWETPAKPDPAPFERATAALGVAPDRTVVVGDDPATDVAGARAAGCPSVLVSDDDTGADPAPDAVVPALPALVARLSPGRRA